jgi:hypothetical protein
MVHTRKEVKPTMCMHHHMTQPDCSCHGGCGEFLTLEEEVKRMEIHKQHLQFQLAMLERRIESMKKATK